MRELRASLASTREAVEESQASISSKNRRLEHLEQQLLGAQGTTGHATPGKPCSKHGLTTPTSAFGRHHFPTPTTSLQGSDSSLDPHLFNPTHESHSSPTLSSSHRARTSTIKREDVSDVKVLAASPTHRLLPEYYVKRSEQNRVLRVVVTPLQKFARHTKTSLMRMKSPMRKEERVRDCKRKVLDQENSPFSVKAFKCHDPCKETEVKVEKKSKNIRKALSRSRLKRKSVGGKKKAYDLRHRE